MNGLRFMSSFATMAPLSGTRIDCRFDKLQTTTAKNVQHLGSHSQQLCKNNRLWHGHGFCTAAMFTRASCGEDIVSAVEARQK